MASLCDKAQIMRLTSHYAAHERCMTGPGDYFPKPEKNIITQMFLDLYTTS